MTRLTGLSRRMITAIVALLNRELKVAIVRGRNGKLSVRSLDRYVVHRKRMRDMIMIRKRRPWEARKKDPLWPIGSRPIGVKGRVSRDEIYADER